MNKGWVLLLLCLAMLGLQACDRKGGAPPKPLTSFLEAPGGPQSHANQQLSYV